MCIVLVFECKTCRPTSEAVIPRPAHLCVGAKHLHVDQWRVSLVPRLHPGNEANGGFERGNLYLRWPPNLKAAKLLLSATKKIVGFQCTGFHLEKLARGGS